uniref:Uncharacterized protein n=2 Tax=Heterosigma akashiwo TaxID=2829 RepID=A0A7S3Y2C5_HETAK
MLLLTPAKMATTTAVCIMGAVPFKMGVRPTGPACRSMFCRSGSKSSARSSFLSRASCCRGLFSAGPQLVLKLGAFKLLVVLRTTGPAAFITIMLLLTSAKIATTTAVCTMGAVLFKMRVRPTGPASRPFFCCSGSNYSARSSFPSRASCSGLFSAGPLMVLKLGAFMLLVVLRATCPARPVIAFVLPWTMVKVATTSIRMMGAVPFQMGLRPAGPTGRPTIFFQSRGILDAGPTTRSTVLVLGLPLVLVIVFLRGLSCVGIDFVNLGLQMSSLWPTCFRSMSSAVAVAALGPSF